MAISRKQLLSDAISPDDQLYVNRLRRYLNDTAVQNDLKELEECTDIEIQTGLYDTLDEINYEFSPETNYTKLSQWPAWSSLKNGVICNILISKGLLKARNALTYNDAGGITVSEGDLWQRYLAFYNTLKTQFRASVTEVKRRMNIDACWGGTHSEYLDSNDQFN